MNRWGVCGGVSSAFACTSAVFREPLPSSGSAASPGPITSKQWERQAWLSPLFRGSENSSD